MFAVACAYRTRDERRRRGQEKNARAWSEANRRRVVNSDEKRAASDPNVLCGLSAIAPILSRYTDDIVWSFYLLSYGTKRLGVVGSVL